MGFVARPLPHSHFNGKNWRELASENMLVDV